MTDELRSYEYLDEMPIEKLGLSVSAINALKRTGMTTVGDCIDYFLRAADPAIMPHETPSLINAMHGEVEQKLRTWLASLVKTDAE